MRESGEAVGQYAIHQGTLSISDSYTIVFHPGIFTIQPSELEIARDESGREMLSVDQLTYGDPLNGSEQIHGAVISNATAEEVPGTFAWEKDGEFLPVGIHELTWIFQPDDQDKYTPITGIPACALLKGKRSITATIAIMTPLVSFFIIIVSDSLPVFLRRVPCD